MSLYFITEGFSTDIKNNVVDAMFPSLNTGERGLLLNHLLDITDLICIKFNFDVENRKVYEDQFRQNSYRDLKGLLLMLLPFINEPTGSTTEIRNLNDIYTARLDNQDINSGTPKYKYSNIQYGRCNRSGNRATQIPFSEAHLQHNVTLLKETIQTIANKLFVNWADVRPYDTNTYKDTNMYKETIRAFNPSGRGNLKYWEPETEPFNYRSLELDTNSFRYYRGMFPGDIYDTLFNELYHNIKDHKWLIYDPIVIQINVPYIIFYHKILNLDNCANGLRWNQQSTEHKTRFRLNWQSLVNNAKTGQSMPIDPNFPNVPNKELKNLVKSAVMFFNGNYAHIGKLEREGFERLDMEDKEVDPAALDRNIDAIKAEDMYEFFRMELEAFKSTPYGSDIFSRADKEKGEILPGIEEMKKGGFVMHETDISAITGEASNRLSVTYKNIYNFSKSLVHKKVKGEFIELPRLWRGLSKSLKEEVLNRLNMSSEENVISWFNMSEIIRVQVGYDEIPEADSREVKQELATLNTVYHNAIRRELVDVIFRIMVQKGFLSSFEPEPRITNKAMLPSEYKPKISAIKRNMSELVLNNKELQDRRWNHAYYFLTGTKYSELGPYTHKPDGSPAISNLSYFQYIAMVHLWYTNYAMDWISQIGFFHKYLNNRVMYVTGATGVGKSTQIPKLLVYAMRILDYKAFGKVVVTQPRIPPTTGNATRIADELGVPIRKYVKEYGEKVTLNSYHVQFKHQESSHITKSKVLNMKITTDGSLVADLSNPLLKKRKWNKKKKDYDYELENIYDIVVVDEAHEHNANMDIILSLITSPLYYNNDLKLVIISATMDEDEPTYRRYYRDINDNRMYPLNSLIKDKNLDRVNVDRRFHISPPGETTKFVITDIFRPDENPLDIVREIIKTTPDGDVLLFQPGEREILATVEELNKTISRPDVITLPYFSNMHSSKKEFVENIEKLKYELTISKVRDFKSTNLNRTRDVPVGTYKRVILVATNIAEASITISSLRFVVDTGIQKVSTYNFRTRGGDLKPGPISESSRLQRRGRVGRTADGTVYYMYREGLMADNKTAYNISTSDISANLYKIMQEMGTEEALFTEKNDPNSRELKIDGKKLKKHYCCSIDNVVQKQYMVDGKLETYYGHDKHNDYGNNRPPKTFYKSGYTKQDLDDIDGSLYIVHPDELGFNRNITGKIVGSNNQDVVYNSSNNQIRSLKMESFWNMLAEYLFIYKTQDEKNLTRYFKTDYGVKLMQIVERIKIKKVDVTFKDIVSLIFGRQYDVFEDMMILLPMYWTSTSMDEWIQSYYVNGKFRRKIDEAKSLFGNCESDSVALLKMGKAILGYLESKGLVQQNKIRPSEEYIRIMSEKKRVFLEGVTENIYEKLTYDDYQTFEALNIENKLSRSNSLSNEELDQLIGKNSMANTSINKIDASTDVIESLCKQFYLDYVTVTNFLRTYMRFRNEMYKKTNKLYDIDYNAKDNDVDFDWFDPKLIGFRSNAGSRESRITKALLHGHGYNVVKNMDGSKFYVQIRSPTPDSITTIKPLTPWMPVPLTFMKDHCTKGYLLFLARDTDKGTISLVHRVTPEQLQETTINLYSPSMFLIDDYDIRRLRKIVTELVRSLTGRFTETKHSQITKAINNYTQCLTDVRGDILNTYDGKMWKRLFKVEPTKTYQLMIYQSAKTEKKNTKYVLQRGGSRSRDVKMNHKLNYVNEYIEDLYNKLN